MGDVSLRFSSSMPSVPSVAPTPVLDFGLPILDWGFPPWALLSPALYLPRRAEREKADPPVLEPRPLLRWQRTEGPKDSKRPPGQPENPAGKSLYALNPLGKARCAAKPLLGFWILDCRFWIGDSRRGPSSPQPSSSRHGRRGRKQTRWSLDRDRSSGRSAPKAQRIQSVHRASRKILPENPCTL